MSTAAVSAKSLDELRKVGKEGVSDIHDSTRSRPIVAEVRPDLSNSTRTGTGHLDGWWNGNHFFHVTSLLHAEFQ